MVMSTVARTVKVYKLGRISFNNAWDIQKKVAQVHLNSMKDGYKTIAEDTILLVEHDPVYTVGIRSKEYSETEERRLRDLGAEFVRTDRGGLITFHGPGQLVAYPILNLGHFRKSMKWYVCQLEKSVIKMCEKFDIKATTSPHTGVWVGDNKLAAIGIHGSRFVTTHGIAINCDVDMHWFNHIVPCGLPNLGVTSLTELIGRKVNVAETIPYFIDAFSNQFQCEISWAKIKHLEHECNLRNMEGN